MKMNIPDRDIIKVVTEMLTKIPKSSDNADLIEALDLIIELTTILPADDAEPWLMTHKLMRACIPVPYEDWHFEVLSIYGDISIEVVKNLVISTIFNFQ